jgi:tRNA-5-methyluridine54 2-sulfurtransferase
MKCRKCSQKAIINMRQHRLAMCKEHFLDWVPEQVERFIHKYQMFSRQERILIAVSGGKDSLALWDILFRLGFESDGLYIRLGIDEGIHYSEKSRQLAETFAKTRNLRLLTVEMRDEYGETIPQIAERTTRGQGKPCAVCGLSKRHIMNRIARQGGYHVLATGHNLDDEVAVLFGNTLNWEVGFMARQGPVLEANHPGLVRKVKPLFRFSEREVAAYALLRGIEYIHEECPHAVGSKSIIYKEILNQMEEQRPGAKLNYYLTFLKAKDNGLFSIHAQEQINTLSTCPSCGQPTTASGECSFCRIFTKQ